MAIGHFVHQAELAYHKADEVLDEEIQHAARGGQVGLAFPSVLHPLPGWYTVCIRVVSYREDACVCHGNAAAVTARGQGEISTLIQ
jgi:hypothetical protein